MDIHPPFHSQKQVLIFSILEFVNCEELLGNFHKYRTGRGKRHLEELIRSKEEGMSAAILFLVMRRGAEAFSPNRETDPEFADTLVEAVKRGVVPLAYLFDFDGRKITMLGKLPVRL